MTLYKKTIEGSHPYETPLVKSLEILSEGVLCGSYGDAGAAGKDLDVENEWDF